MPVEAEGAKKQHKKANNTNEGGRAGRAEAEGMEKSTQTARIAIV